MNPANLFICGCPWSGTSAAALWLCGSQSFALGMERYQRYWAGNLALPEDAFEEGRFFKMHEGDTWYDSLDEFAEHYKRLSSVWSRARFFGDKIPSLWRDFPKLFAQFPEGRVIFMYRDPFAVARSYKVRASNPGDATWGKQRDATMGILEWNSSARAVVQLFNQETPGYVADRRCLVLGYEQFISNSLDRRALGSFLGLDERLPLAGEWKRAIGQRAAEPLSEVEKDLLWSLLDTGLVREMARIARTQLVTLARVASAANPPMRREWYHSADRRDAGIEYGELTVPGCGYVFRGRSTSIDQSKPFGACIGSATTFGRFIRNPYPKQLEAATAMPFYNLGISGARPEAYLANESLMEMLRKANIVIVELMSARGYPSALFAPAGYDANKGQFMDWLGWHAHRGADARLNWLLTQGERNEPVFVDHVYEIGFPYLTPEQREFLRDTVVAHYTNDLMVLLREIGKPVLGLLVTRSGPWQARGTREPSSFAEWSGSYPHFVDGAVVAYLRHQGIPVVISRSGRGLPFTVRNWKNNEPAAVFPWQQNPSLNSYYPSQEIHDDAAAELLKHPLIRGIVNVKAGAEPAMLPPRPRLSGIGGGRARKEESVPLASAVLSRTN